MFGLTHLFDNALVGLALMSVLFIFVASVLVAALSCFRPSLAPKNRNFTYVSTAITGLVLSVASGVLGKPTTVTVQPKLFAMTTQGSTPTNSFQASISDSQVTEYQQLYAWSYVVIGLAALLVFMVRTPANHDLVKNVALTTLGFLVTVVGTIASKTPADALAAASSMRDVAKNVVAIVPKTSVLF